MHALGEIPSYVSKAASDAADYLVSYCALFFFYYVTRGVLHDYRPKNVTGFWYGGAFYAVLAALIGAGLVSSLLDGTISNYLFLKVLLILLATSLYALYRSKSVPKPSKSDDE